MKINARIYRSLTGEPIEVQEVNNKKVEVHYMNDTKYLSQYVPKGRFYLWTSDGKDYRLLVEKGFYKKVDYFFTEEINGIWIDFLDDLGATHSKGNRKFLFLTMGITVAILALAAIFIPEQLLWAMIGTLVLTMIANTVQSRKITAIVREKNIAAQERIKAILTEEGFNQLLQDQDDYMKEYFEVEEEDSNSVEEIEEIETEGIEEIEIEEKDGEGEKE